MPAPDLYTHFLQRLNATGIRHMITGGLAAIGPPSRPRGA